MMCGHVSATRRRFRLLYSAVCALVREKGLFRNGASRRSVTLSAQRHISSRRSFPNSLTCILTHFFALYSRIGPYNVWVLRPLFIVRATRDTLPIVITRLCSSRARILVNLKCMPAARASAHALDYTNWANDLDTRGASLRIYESCPLWFVSRVELFVTWRWAPSSRLLRAKCLIMRTLEIAL